MNKIVVPHYPVEHLPADLRSGLETGSFVTVTLDPDPSQATAKVVSTLAELFAGLDPNRPRKTTDEIVSEIGKLRDEWD